MNKVKTIKVKNEDGSISEESYSIAADAVNVDMANGKNVQETIGTIDVDKDGDIAIQLKNKIDKNNIIDNLNSSDNNKVLSATQGKVLNEAIAAANSEIKKKIYYFNTIAKMKAADLQAGDTCQTLGYYLANDGVVELYKIVDDDTLIDDGNNIYDLDNGLKAVRIIDIKKQYYIMSTDYLDENSEDNSTAFNTMVNKAIEENKSIIIKKGIYKFTKPITIYSQIPIIGAGNVLFDFSEFNDNSDYCVHVTKTNQISYSIARNKTILQNINFKGYNSNFSNYHPNVNEYLNKSLFFIETHEFDFDNIYAYGFNKVFTYGNNAYIISVRNSIISHNNYAIYFDYTGYTNLGERITFINCVIGNNRIAMHVKIGMFNFTDCSIDYNLQICDYFQSKISGTSSGRSCFSGCHFEDNNSNLSNRFITNSAVLLFTNCTFWFGSLPYFIDNSSGDGNRLKFSNCDFIPNMSSTDGSYNTPFIQTNKQGVSEVNSTLRSSYNSFIKFTKFNKYISNNYSKLIANITNGTAELDTDSSLKLTSGNYVTAETNTDYIEIPLGYTKVWISYLIKGSAENTTNKQVFAFYDDNKEHLSTISTNWVTTSDYVYKTAVAEIPTNAKYVKVFIQTPLFSGGVTNYKDIYIDFM